MNDFNKKSDLKTKKKEGWDLYRNFIKKDAVDVSDVKKLDAANKIISLCKRMEPYTAYVLTCLSIAEYYLNGNSPEEGKEWLLKLDKPYLENKALKYIGGFSREEMYWSQLRKFFELKALYFSKTNNTDKCIWMYFCLLDQCSNSKTQIETINNLIYNEIYKTNIIA